ncbi:MAG: DUF2842 domain-containing protein [Gemmobacter sp.]|jgi:hypothetical protein|nr:DUF2842 domain-containing protein [Gemmobacter sp.]
MALSYRTRRRLSLLILIVGLPLYIALVWGIMGALDRPPIWLEFVIYIVLGFLWMLPFKFVFKGVGQADPDTHPVDQPGEQSGRR